MNIARPRARTIAATFAALALSALGVTTASAAVGDPIIVNGVVTDANGNPMAYTFVNVFGGGDFQSVQTDDSGAYAVTLIPTEDPAWVHVSAFEAQCENPGPVSAPATITVNCAVPNLITISISGTATTDNGTSAEGLWVQAQDESWTSFGGGPIGADGTFAFDMQVSDAVDSIHVFAPNGDTVATLTGLFDGASFTGIDFTFHPYPVATETEFTVTGRVTDKKNHPITDATVEISTYDVISSVHTDVNGNYTATYTGYWVEEIGYAEPIWVSVDGVIVDYVSNSSPAAPSVVNYRVGKSPLFEPFLMGLEITGWDAITDIYRKVDADGNAKWRVCTDGYCYGAAFGSKKTEVFAITEMDDYAGTAQVQLRERNGDTFDWWSLGPDEGLNDAATFGVRNFNQVDFFSYLGDGSNQSVYIGDTAGDTTVWAWGLADGLAVTSQVVPGRFVSAEHLDLDASEGDELVVVTHKGQRYTVTLLASMTADPEVIATGKGAPTVSYQDPEGDGTYEVRVTFPAPAS